MISRVCFALTCVSVLVSAASKDDSQCVKCDAYGELRAPNKAFTHREQCREFLCKCNCNGDWECPPDRVETFCQPSNPQCGTCWAGGAMQVGDKSFKFNEGCYQYNCFCNCDGEWNCPSEKTIDVCKFNVTSGCYFCDVYGVKYDGNSRFKHVNGCIDYDCTCNCDGSWNCPGEQAVDTCNQNPRTGCYYCDVHGQRYEGNSHFTHVNGCIEYDCVCNCDGSWDCPGERAVDTCRTNRTTGCYYCDVYGYLHEGNSKFPLVQECFLYQCDCNCDGGWTCKHSQGKYVCDAFGNDPISECRSCDVEGNAFRGESRFYYKKGCITYKCSCDCGGRYYCPGSDAFYTCPGMEGEQIASLSSRYTYVYTELTRPTRQIQGCLPCEVDGKTYDAFETFYRQSGCNQFRCTCQCNGRPNCPTDTRVNVCIGITGGGSGASTFGSDVDPEYTELEGGTGVNICIQCTYRGISYEGNSPFTFESGCWKYNCQCACNGSIDCPSDRSKYICPGRKECIKCKVDDRLITANTEFELRRGCVFYDKCRCNCDGGWNCDDGVYTCDLCQGCKVDGRTYAGNSTFVLTRGCDRYKSCSCGCDSKWQCTGEVEDLCGACRKCKIGDDYFDGDSSFPAQVGCTRYSQCTCNCDGSYRCIRGVYTCGERGDLPVEDHCADCVHGGRRYRPEQRFDYQDSCAKYRGCQCKCGKTTCRQIEDTCGNCRSCLVDSTERRGNTTFSLRRECYDYKKCDCFCSGQWKCYGESAVDTCNTCKKCNVDDVIHDEYSRFQLDRDCWRYHCFCGCNGWTNCPAQTAVNTCTQPDVCYTCEAGGKEYRGNSLFTYDDNGIKMSCKCSCDGSYFCIAEWMYIKTDLTISGSDTSGCFYCYLDGGQHRGNSNFTIIKNDIEMDCQCFCNGGYYCYGEHLYESNACRGCDLYGQNHAGDSEFSLVYNGFKLACQCECDGTYLCYGTEGTAVISCIKGVGCLPKNCGQCFVQGNTFNGGDVFGSTYKGRELKCDCGCDGSYYCEGSGGIILSCVGGFCREFGCTSCEAFDMTYPGDTKFELAYQGMKLSCQCACGGNYECRGTSGEIIVTCIDGGSSCLPVGYCNMCVVNSKRYAGRSTFRYDYEGIAMLCTCSCDGSYYCKGVYELIEISCIGGTCTRIGCESCSVFGLSYNGDTDFNIIYRGMKLDCKCQCTRDYICVGTEGTTVVSCIGGRNCLPATCGSCFVNNRNYAGRSTFRSQYKGIDILCTCGCDSSSYCTGTTTSIEVTCVGGTCTRVGCRECSIFGKEYLGSSQFDLTYGGMNIACQCDCEGGYICRGGDGTVIITCVNGIGAGCLTQRCGRCVVDGTPYAGFSTFDHVYQGIDMKCSCSCDGSYFCKGVTELIEISCVGGTCTPHGCKQCRLYDRQISGATPFNIIYGGYTLDCMCNCDGSYRCLGEGGVVIIQCRDNVNCLPSVCQGCLVNNVPYRGGATFRDVYNGIDVTCTCGCDSSYICQGVSTKITISCVGGRCNPVGCQGCRAFGRNYASFSNFEIYYRGMKLTCECDCDGGYICKGSTDEVFVRCRDGADCLGSTCNSCSFDNRVFTGLSVFKYDYQGIGMSCTCACDGSVFCFGVTEQIEISCIGGTCTPRGCRSCNIFGNKIEPLSAFSMVYGGKRLDCTCACDSGFRCLYKSRVIVDCPAGRAEQCLAPTCRNCEVDGVQHRAKSTFPYRFEDIDMTCTCGCDGSSYCEGVRVDIIVSCVGGTCSPLDCKTCSVFGREYQAYKPFRIVYQGLWLDCSCGCDSGFVCRGQSGDSVVTCRPGETCSLPSTCQDCTVDGRRISSRSTFPYRYEGMAMQCTCGCDGTAVCEGTEVRIIVSCVGGTCAPHGCRDCVLFGRNHAPFRPFQLVYQGTKIDCTCACDSSFVCYGKSKEEVVRCRPGDNCPIGNTCRDCMVDGVRRGSRSVFAYKYGEIDMKCTCGCDGSAYCEGVTEEIIVACIGGTCSVRGCRTCNIFGTAQQAYKPFSVVTEGTKLDCTCKCDSSFVCYGRSGEKIVDCQPGQNCFPSSCTRDCVVDGVSYRPRSTFNHRYRNIDLRCTCGCDATAYCEGVTLVYFVSCIGERCFRLGCESCNLFGMDYDGESSFNIVYKGLSMDCECNCDTSWRCEGKSGGDDINCRKGRRCLPKKCRKCRVGNRRYDGRESFVYDYKNIRMNCVCGCDGTYFCRGVTIDYEISCPRKGPCKQVGGCRTCSIFGTEYHGGSRTDFVYQGYSMTCTCNCDSSFKCIGVKNDVIVDCAIGQNCLPNSCSPCRVDGLTYRGGASFDTVWNGKNMQCTCGCDGSYYCRCRDDGTEITCNARGVCTRVGCTTCLSDGRRHQADEEFEKYYDGIQMNCLCSCDGSYRCQGVSVKIVILCTGGSCNLVGCRSCVVNGQEHATGSDYYFTDNRLRKRCRCECDGTSTCQDDRPTCKQCVIDGKTYPGHSRNRVYRNGQPYICDCHCEGRSECNPEGPVCRQCNIFGQTFPGNREFETIVQGTTMQCKCDCSGSFECIGGGRSCTSASGCVISNCPGCTIEGRKYAGGTNFDIFHNGYGIRMNCDCECSGSYKCTGSKQVTGNCPDGDCANTCFDCTIDGRRHRGGSVFNTVLDGIQMKCQCFCTGGYTCEGQVTSTSVCTGPACLRDGCTDCILEGRTYPSNTEFEISRQGIDMQCTCACNGTLVCKGERREKLCVGANCETALTCKSCRYGGAVIPGNSRFQTEQNGVRQLCDCDCSGRLTCNSRGGNQCTGPGCQTTGCRRCVIDGTPYTGNTRFITTKGTLRMNCTCFCDGTYSCRASNGFEYSCLGDDCPSDQCRACELDGLDYQLDDKFRLAKNDLFMNCVCECDGAYRCFSISGYCTGPDCDDYGCSSCVIGNQRYKGNSRFELKPGTTCECDCSGEYRCNSTAIGFKCVGANCGEGSCKTCLVDNDVMTGNARFQFKKYGLFMQCACNCDSTFTCRGYQIISDGTSPVDIPCTPCTINGKQYNPMTRFQTMIDGERKVCSCSCRGQHSCHEAAVTCRTCVIGSNTYPGNSDFSLYRSGQSIRCRCNCNGDFVCEGQGTCTGPNCGSTCRDCLIFGTRHRGGTRFYTGNNPQLLCDCACTGEYTCKGYRSVAKVLLAPEVDVSSCASCYVAGKEQAGNTNFKIQRDCYVVDCTCGCDGTWECPSQRPQKVCNGSEAGGVKEKVYYSLAGQVGSSGEGGYQFGDTKATLVYRDETSTTIFGQGGGEDCGKCIINSQQFDGNTAFVLQDGCLRWSCVCNCNGGFECSSVVGSSCTGPLDPFEGKSCYSCKAFGQAFPPEKAFTAADKCYRYTCMCNCDGSYECPPEQTVKTCADTSDIYDPDRGTCRQCVLGDYQYEKDEKFEYVYDCIRYICTCKCDGAYFCPASTGIRVCKAGSGLPGRVVTTGSNTVTETKHTFVALKPSGTGSAGSTFYGSTGTGTAGGYTSTGSGGSRIVSGGYSGNAGSGSSSSSSTYVSETTETRTSNTGGGSSYSSNTGSGSSYSSNTGSGSRSSGTTGGSGYSSNTGSGSSYTGTGGGSSYSSNTGGGSSYSSNTGGGGSYSSNTGGGSRYSSSGTAGGSSSSGTAGGSSSSGTAGGSSSSGTAGGSSSSGTAGGSSSSSSYSSTGGGSSYSSTGSGSSQSGQCRPCQTKAGSVPGGRDFSFKDGCSEFHCECFCNGSHVCPADKTNNLCDQDTTPNKDKPATAGNDEQLGCELGGKIFRTQLFSYTDTEKCIKFLCRCFKNGAYYCDPNKSKRVAC